MEEGQDEEVQLENDAEATHEEDKRRRFAKWMMGIWVDYEKGLHPLTDKVDVVVNVPTSRNVNQLKWYVSLLIYFMYVQQVPQQCWHFGDFLICWLSHMIIRERKSVVTWPYLVCPLLSLLTSRHTWGWVTFLLLSHLSAVVCVWPCCCWVVTWWSVTAHNNHLWPLTPSMKTSLQWCSPIN